jgi:hypothetical protein
MADIDTHDDPFTSGRRTKQALANRDGIMFNKSYVPCLQHFIHSTVNVEVDHERRLSSNIPFIDMLEYQTTKIKSPPFVCTAYLYRMSSGGTLYAHYIMYCLLHHPNIQPHSRYTSQDAERVAPPFLSSSNTTNRSVDALTFSSLRLCFRFAVSMLCRCPESVADGRGDDRAICSGTEVSLEVIDSDVCRTQPGWMTADKDGRVVMWNNGNWRR